ncbi:MAG: hypothetical protein JNM84_19930 [Planctomycetes bacterium]|nr:hypothetical protein [Planctomycetota bacterium]
MHASIFSLVLCVAPAMQEPAPRPAAKPSGAATTAAATTSGAPISSTAPAGAGQEGAPRAKPPRADALRTLSARSAVAEKDLLFSTQPEERALRFVASEKQRRIEEQRVKKEELAFLEEGLREQSGEYRELRAAGRHAEADALVQEGKREIVRDIREVLALRGDVRRSEQAAVQMDEAEDKLEKLVGHKQSERRRYERQRDSEGSFEVGGIHPALIPEVSGGGREDAVAPEVEALFKQLFGTGSEISGLRREVAEGLRWKR